MLLLGTGEAGKSTFVKQMKLIHGGGFTDEDKTRFREDLVTNVTDSVVTLSREMMKLGIAYKVHSVAFLRAFSKTRTTRCFLLVLTLCWTLYLNI